MVTSDFIPPEEIENAAIHFLEKYHPDGSIPIPIDEIVEIQLKIKVVPSPDLRRLYGIDAFSTHDFKEIYIDHREFIENENRARFTLAHELGHYSLHRRFIEKAEFKDLGEWREFILNDIKREPLETQANIFAAFLLIPTHDLVEEYKAAKNKLAQHDNFRGRSLPDDQRLSPYLAKPISRKFEVSERCAELRIKNWLNSAAKELNQAH